MNFSKIVATYMSILNMSRVSFNQKDKLRDIDIDKEYELIKQKKSGLSANMRQLVIKRKEQDEEFYDV